MLSILFPSPWLANKNNNARFVEYREKNALNNFSSKITDHH